MAIKTRKEKARKAARKRSANKANAPSVKAPKFLTLRKFKTLAEATRRQRISAARTKVRQTAYAATVVDLSKGFDPAEED